MSVNVYLMIGPLAGPIDGPKLYANYSCSPRESVIAAYAQFSRKDFNTWNYEKAYGHLVRRTQDGWMVDHNDIVLFAKEVRVTS